MRWAIASRAISGCRKTRSKVLNLPMVGEKHGDGMCVMDVRQRPKASSISTLCAGSVTAFAGGVIQAYGPMKMTDDG